MKSVRTIMATAALLAGCATAAFAQTAGVTATEIKLGQSVPYSGPASALGIIGKVDQAYFTMVNDKGGIHGRKVKILSEDDGFNPAKAVEITRRLVEQENVLSVYGTLGTAPNAAIQAYLNQRKVPHIFAAGASRFADPEKSPWTISFYPSYELEGEVLAKYALAQKANAKIAIIYQNDDFGRDFVKGFKAGLGSKVSSVAVEASYDLTDPSVNAQVAQMQASGAEVVFSASLAKFAAQTIRRMGELNWKPLHLLSSPGSSIETALKPGGVENSTGIVSSAIFKMASSPDVANDADVKEYVAFLNKYLPGVSPDDYTILGGYLKSAIMHKILERAGPDLNRETLMKAATTMPPTVIPMVLPGITVSSTPTNYTTFNKVRLQRFDGTKWVLLEDTAK
jgi:ABC-type branched-subunit amino acid transport system substrate-binding protein